MSNKRKAVVLGGFLPLTEDARARFKHQTLLQDYQDLQKEAVGVRMKLDAAKQRRRALLAEVRFLRRRQRYLLKIKSMECPEEQPSTIENQHELTTKGRKSHKREVTQFKVPLLLDLKPKGRVYAGEGTALKNTTSAHDLNHKVGSRRGKVASQHNSPPMLDVNYMKMISSGSNAAARNIGPATFLRETEKFQGGNEFRSRTPALDLNLSNGVGRKEAVLPGRIPTFDLNEVSVEEEELQAGYEPGNSEESRRSLIRAGNDEQPSDMKISVCRNAGERPSRIGKRKISWQDPVALRV